MKVKEFYDVRQAHGDNLKCDRDCFKRGGEYNIEVDKTVGMIENFDSFGVSRCATCNHYKPIEIQVSIKCGDATYQHTTCTNELMFKKLRIRYSSVNNLHIEPTPDFGCPFHSAYEVQYDT